MTTLIDFADEKTATYLSLRDEARSLLSQATEELKNARVDYDSRVSEFADLEKQVRVKRTELTGALMPADMEALAAELRDLIGEQRKSRSGLLDAEKKTLESKNSLDHAEMMLNRYSGELDEWEKEKAVAGEREGRHAKWKQMVSDGVLADLAADAGALLDYIDSAPGPPDSEDPLAAAKILIAEVTDRITGDLPENLLTRARELRDGVKNGDSSRMALLASVEEEAAKHWEADEGSEGTADGLWLEFLRKERSFKEFVLSGQSTYDRAVTMLQSVTESTELTDAERNRINDTDLVTDGEAALSLEKSRDEARAAKEEKEAELTLAIVKAKAADIDADPEDDTDVQTLQDELTPLEDAFTAAEDAYTETMQDNLDLWEASVPDHIWNNLYAYGEAIALLTHLKDGDPNAMATGMDETESNLVEALETLDSGIRTGYFLEDTVITLGKEIEYNGSHLQQRILTAIQGAGN